MPWLSAPMNKSPPISAQLYLAARLNKSPTQNKQFKEHGAVMYDKWLANAGINQETACGNLKAPPRRDVLQWIVSAWGKLSTDLIKNLFVCCG